MINYLVNNNFQGLSKIGVKNGTNIFIQMVYDENLILKNGTGDILNEIRSKKIK